MRRSPVNCFEHKFYFRTIHASAGSALRGQEGCLQSRLFPPPEVMTKDKAKQFVEWHAKKNLRVSGPFISLTSDLLRAFNIAYNYRLDGKSGISILVIDSWKLDGSSFISCNELREIIGLETKSIFNTETLV